MVIRHVSVIIPDTEEAESQVQNFAAQLRAGQELIVIVRPKEIPNEEMPALVAEMVHKIQMRAVVSRINGPH